MDTTVAEQLVKSGIDVVTAQELQALGDSDEQHLQRATEMKRVVCTQDQDFLRIARNTPEHAGIAFAEQYGATIGGWVKALRNLHASTTAEEIQGQIRFLSVK